MQTHTPGSRRFLRREAPRKRSTEGGGISSQKCISIFTLLYCCESWKTTEKVKRKLNGAASKMLATITGRTIQDRRWSWLRHVLRMPEHRLVREVLLNCVKPTHETLFADVPNLSIENATEMSKDRKLWSSNRPSLRCQPLLGGVAIK